MNRRFHLVAILAALGSVAVAADFNETEPNDSKAAANVFAGLVSGDRVLGSIAVTDDVDWFRVTMAAKSSGIWLTRLQWTLPGGGPVVEHNAHIMGLNQVAGTIGTTATNLQDSQPNTTVPNSLQWYGFGKSESLYFAVDSPSVPGDYVATLTQTEILPTVIEPWFQDGSFTITTVGTTGTTQTDTDIWLYDANFNALAGHGNDDTSATVLGSTLTRNLTPGTYYLAISTYNLANNQASPADDAYRNGPVTDFPNILLDSSTAGDQGAENISFRISNSWDIYNQVAFKESAYQVGFYQFTVVPEPGTVAVLVLGGLGLAARRRRAKGR